MIWGGFDMDIVVFGSGKVAKKLLSYPLRQGNRIVGIYDNNREKWGTVV